MCSAYGADRRPAGIVCYVPVHLVSDAITSFSADEVSVLHACDNKFKCLTFQTFVENFPKLKGFQENLKHLKTILAIFKRSLNFHGKFETFQKLPGKFDKIFSLLGKFERTAQNFPGKF